MEKAVERQERRLVYERYYWGEKWMIGLEVYDGGKSRQMVLKQSLWSSVMGEFVETDNEIDFCWGFGKNVVDEDKISGFEWAVVDKSVHSRLMIFLSTGVVSNVYADFGEGLVEI
jgi:hypothetical protein